jgi:hypothetical protein
MDAATFIAGLRNPFWMPRLQDWWWRRPDGVPQGPACFVEQPGLANLIWLALDAETPPGDGFDMRQAKTAMWCIAAACAPFAGSTLEQWCAVHSLEEFSALPEYPGHFGLLIRTAKKKVAHAHP